MVKAIEAREVRWKYLGREEPALRGLSLSVEKGEFVAIMGPSGAGKTTFVLTLNGTIPQRLPGDFSGSVKVLGMDTREHDVTELARKVAIVFEDPEMQFVMTTVEDEIVLGLEPLGLSREEMEERIKWSLDLVGLSKDFLDRHPYQLSGGEKQRVAIATALARHPEVLVLDEPTSDLDPQGKEEVVSAIRRVRDELDITVILVEHESEIVAEFADRVIVLREGKVFLEGEPREVFAKAKELKEIGVYPPETAEISARLELSSIALSAEELAEALKGKVSINQVRREADDGASRRLVARCVSIEYVYPGGIKALRGVNLEVREGEFIALVGPNGSGKTTLAKVMAGLLTPTKGDVLIAGRSVKEYGRAELARLVGYVHQNPDHQLFCQKVYDEVAFGLRLLGLPEDEVKRRVEEVLKLVNLSGLEDEHPFFLSKGEKRRLALASVYALNPRLLIVDEPTTGQDRGFCDRIMALLKALTRDGKAVIVITHSIPIAAKYADRIVVLKSGKVIADGSPRDILASRAVEEGRLIIPQTLKVSRLLGLNGRYAPLTPDEFVRAVSLTC